MGATTEARPRFARAEPVLAIAAFAALCLLALTVTPTLIGPDGDAYRASIIAITEGHLLSLSAGQVHALAVQLERCPFSHNICLIAGPSAGHGPVIAQWLKLPDGSWISEKNPGYPFLAAPFQAWGIIRLAPLFYAALGCLGLYAGARRWLGRGAGAIAVGLFCSCDLVMVFAWQSYWSTLTDAALIAAGAGTLLWVVLAQEAPARHRTWLGLLSFLAIEAAVFARYTNLVVLGCAVAAVLAVARLRPRSFPPKALAYWLISAAISVLGLAAFDDLVYGGPFKTGYRPGEITFSAGAIIGNERYMPARLVEAMPVLLLALAGLVLITARRIRSRTYSVAKAAQARRDFAIGLAVAAPWLAIWALYAAYNWTAQPGIGAWQSARFYLPALGPVTLLGTWLLSRLPDLAHLPRRALVAAAPAVAAIVALFAIGSWTFRYQVNQATPSAGPPHCNIGQAHCPAKPPPTPR
jgi:hypothetical protein